MKIYRTLILGKKPPENEHDLWIDTSNIPNLVLRYFDGFWRPIQDTIAPIGDYIGAVASREQLTTLTVAQKGDMAKVTDDIITSNDGLYWLNGDYKDESKWVQIIQGINNVISVNGKKGEVVLIAKDIGLESVDNTSDMDKPVSLLQASAIADAKKEGTEAKLLATEVQKLTEKALEDAAEAISLAKVAKAYVDTEISDLKSEIIDGATTGYATLGNLESKVKANATAASTAQSTADLAVNTAANAQADASMAKEVATAATSAAQKAQADANTANIAISKLNGTTDTTSVTKKIGNAITALNLGSASKKTAGNNAGNVPVLGSDGKLNVNTLPSLALTDTKVVDTKAEMLALTDVQTGDVCIVVGESKTFILSAAGPSIESNWKQILSPTSDITKVYIDEEIKELKRELVDGASPEYNTLGNIETKVKGVISEVQSTKEIANTVTTHISNKNNPHSVTKAQIGLEYVDNTSDINKIVSKPQAAAIQAVNDIANAAYTLAESKWTFDENTFAKVNGDITKDFYARELVVTNLRIPSTLPSNPTSGEHYLYLDENGTGSEIPSGGGSNVLWGDGDKVNYNELYVDNVVKELSLRGHRHNISDIKELQDTLDSLVVSKAKDSDKLGGILAADYYHKGNSNKSDVDWSAKKLKSKTLVIPTEKPTDLAAGEHGLYLDSNGTGAEIPSGGGSNVLWAAAASGGYRTLIVDGDSGTSLAVSGHQHNQSDIVGLSAALSGKVDTTDSRLTNARPASDVYAWAKASVKPSYSWGELTTYYYNSPAGGIDNIPYTLNGIISNHCPGVELDSIISMKDYANKTNQLLIRGYDRTEFIKFRTQEIGIWRTIYHSGNLTPATIGAATASSVITAQSKADLAYSLAASKWTYNVATIAAVKVNNAVNADTLGGHLASYFHTQSAEYSFGDNNQGGWIRIGKFDATTVGVCDIFITNYFSHASSEVTNFRISAQYNIFLKNLGSTGSLVSKVRLIGASGQIKYLEVYLPNFYQNLYFIKATNCQYFTLYQSKVVGSGTASSEWGIANDKIDYTSINSDNLGNIAAANYYHTGNAPKLKPELVNGNANLPRYDGVRTLYNGSTGTNYPDEWYGGLSVLTGYVGFQLMTYGGGGATRLKLRHQDGNSGWNDWQDIYHSGNSNKSDVDWRARNLSCNGLEIPTSPPSAPVAGKHYLYISN